MVAKLPHAVAHRPEFQVVTLPRLKHHILWKRHVVPCKRTENVGQLMGSEIRFWLLNLARCQHPIPLFNAPSQRTACRRCGRHRKTTHPLLRTRRKVLAHWLILAGSVDPVRVDAPRLHVEHSDALAGGEAHFHDGRQQLLP